MKKGLILSLICLLTLCGCGKIRTLQNGEEAVITFAKDEKEHKITQKNTINNILFIACLSFLIEALIIVILNNMLFYEKYNFKNRLQSNEGSNTKIEQITSKDTQNIDLKTEESKGDEEHE